MIPFILECEISINLIIFVATNKERSISCKNYTNDKKNTVGLKVKRGISYLSVNDSTSGNGNAYLYGFSTNCY